MSHYLLPLIRLCACIGAAICALAFPLHSFATATSPSPTEPATEGFRIDSEKGGVGGIYVGMPWRELRNIEWPYTPYGDNIEGNLCEVHLYRLSKDNLPSVVYLEVSYNECTSILCGCLPYDSETRVMAATNTISQIISYSKGVHDQYGLGVGSSLAELKRYYPERKVAHEMIKAWRYATFAIDAKVTFSFDPDIYKKSCAYRKKRGCIPDENVLVQSLRIR